MKSNYRILVNTDNTTLEQSEILNSVITSIDTQSSNLYVYDMLELYQTIRISETKANQKFHEIHKNIREFFEKEAENKCVIFTNVNFSVITINNFFSGLLKTSNKNIVVIGKYVSGIEFGTIQQITHGKSSNHFRNNLRKLIKKLQFVSPVDLIDLTDNSIIYLGGIDSAKKEYILTMLNSEIVNSEILDFNLEKIFSLNSIIEFEKNIQTIYTQHKSTTKIFVFDLTAFSFSKWSTDNYLHDDDIIRSFVKSVDKFYEILNGKFLFMFSDDLVLENFLSIKKPNAIYGFSTSDSGNIKYEILNNIFGISQTLPETLNVPEEINTVNQTNNNQKETYSQDCIILHKADKMDSLFGIELAKTKASENIEKRFFNFTEEHFERNSYEILFDLFSSEENPIILCIENVNRHEKYLDLIHNYKSLFDNIQVVLIMDEDVVVYVEERFATPTVKSILLDLSKIEFNENFFIEKCTKLKKFVEKEISNINIVMCKDFETFDWYYDDFLNNLRSQPNTLCFEFDFTKKLRKSALAKSVSEINNFSTKQEKIIVFSSTKTLGHDTYVDDLVSVLKNDADTKIFIVDMISEFNGRLLTKLGLEVDKFLQTENIMETQFEDSDAYNETFEEEFEQASEPKNNISNQSNVDDFIQKHKPKTKATPYFSDKFNGENVIFVKYHPEFVLDILIGTQTNFGNVTNFKFEKETKTTFLTLENKSDVIVMDVDSDDLKFFPYQIYTEDLHAKYEHDEAYFVNKDFKSFPYKETINEFYSSDEIQKKIAFFHSEEIAKDYYNFNKPLFSMQEMKNLLENDKSLLKRLTKKYNKKLK